MKTEVPVVDTPAFEALCQSGYREYSDNNCRRTDVFFAGLMLLQWVGAILVAIFVSPVNWFGSESRIHIHIYAAVFLGGTIVSLPLFLIWKMPGQTLTRHVVAIGQMASSALLIHLCGGRIETHFHAFGSLAFLSFYRDWRVLVTATLAAGFDHLLRGAFWPESVYGSIYVSHWRTLEHIGWMLFENVFLISSCLRSQKEMKLIVQRQCELEAVNAYVEARIIERTTELHWKTIELEMRTVELQAERELAMSADRAKSEFLANMSHEIRTPLAAILGYAEILYDDGDIARAPMKRIETIRTIQNNGNHLLSLVNNILDLSKIEAGGMTLEPVVCSPRQILAECVSTIAVKAHQKGTETYVLGESTLPEWCLSDPMRLKQILLNLANNAIKFTESGSITFSASYSTDSHLLQIDVIDTGIGIPSEVIERVFEPFSQADTSTTRKFGGTGLGLTISRKIARLLGGDVTLARSAVGEGSVFRMVIRAEEVEPKIVPVSFVPALPIAQSPRAMRAGCRVLLAEDGPDNQRIIKYMLNKAGAVVTIVENGLLVVDEALEASRNQSEYDVILMDMQMPVMDGYVAVARLRAENYTGSIIALTAHAMPGDREKCLAAGCDGYLAKPVDRAEMIAMVAQLSPTVGEPAEIALSH